MHARPLGEDWRKAALVFFASLVVYYLHFGTITEKDAVPAPYTAWAIVQKGSVDLRGYEYVEEMVGGAVKEGRDGRWVTKYPPGSSLAAVPFVLPFAGSGPEPPRSSVMRRLGKLTAATHVAAAAALIFLICAGVAPGGARVATIVFAAGTTLWPVASQSLWSHGPATFWIALALYALLRPASLGISVLAGLALGMAVLTRPTTGLFLAATLAALAYRRSFRGLFVAGAAASVPIGALFLYNVYLFGGSVVGGYAAEVDRWTTPVWYGFTGLMLSPSRGLLVYTPAFWMIFVGWRHVAEFVRRSEAGPLVIAWAGAALATAGVYGHWHGWWGGWCYGPRTLSETLPIFALLLAIAVEPLRRRAARIAIVVLVTLSVAINALGVFAEDGSAWKKRHDRGGPRFSFYDTQIEAHLRELLGMEDRGAKRRR